jgi:hypothetical protein
LVFWLQGGDVTGGRGHDDEMLATEAYDVFAEPNLGFIDSGDTAGDIVLKPKSIRK